MGRGVLRCGMSLREGEEIGRWAVDPNWAKRNSQACAWIGTPDESGIWTNSVAGGLKDPAGTILSLAPEPP